MSLTSQIAAPHVKALLKNGVVKPDLGPPVTILAPPCGDPAQVGIAFDYALRWGLAGRGLGVMDHLVAESALRRAKTTPSLEPYVAKIRAELVVAKASMAAAQPLDEQLLTDVAIAFFRLARLDVVCRTGEQYIKATLDREATPDDLHDLRALYKLVPWEAFRPQAELLLNPNFGLGSGMIGGADGDLVLDDMIVEIKTTKDLRPRKEHIDQLVGYALLADRFGVDGRQSKAPLTRAGIYFSRAGVLRSFNLKDCLRIDPDTLLDALLDVRRGD